jgi:hypothetical protein
MIILLDRSFSMTGQKWTNAVAAVESFTEARQGIMRFGLVLFPWEDPASPSCGSASWIVPCDFYTADRISRELSWTSLGGQTPTASALQVVADGLAASESDDRARYIILVTDGDPTCPGATLDDNVEMSVDVLDALHEAGVSTFVIGFGAEVSPARLDRLAQAGGMARTGARCADPNDPDRKIDCDYYDASDNESLMQAFNEIVAIAQGELSGRTCDDSCYVIDGCPEGQRCIARVVDYDGDHAMNLGTCVDDPCSGISCAKDEFCRGGSCIAACMSACPNNQVCQDGACVPPPTGEAGCDETCHKYLVCMNGSCVDDPCRAVTCPTKAPYCYRGSCYSTGDDGEGGNDSDGGDEPSSNGDSDSGCGCQSGAALPGQWLLALLALPIVRRR